MRHLLWLAGRGLFVAIFIILCFTKVQAKPPMIGKIHIPYSEYVAVGIPGEYTGYEVAPRLMVIEANGSFLFCTSDFASTAKEQWNFVQGFKSLDEVKSFLNNSSSAFSQRPIDGFVKVDLHRSQMTSEQLAQQVRSNQLTFNPYNAYQWQAFKANLVKVGVIGTVIGCVGTLMYLIDNH